jgi:hypothetical protein
MMVVVLIPSHLRGHHLVILDDGLVLCDYHLVIQDNICRFLQPSGSEQYQIELRTQLQS